MLEVRKVPIDAKHLSAPKGREGAKGAKPFRVAPIGTCRPDVLGQLKDGRLLGVEVKGPAGKLRPGQSLFLDRIRCAGGAAFVARDCRDVLRELQPRKDATT